MGVLLHHGVHGPPTGGLPTSPLPFVGHSESDSAACTSATSHRSLAWYLGGEACAWGAVLVSGGKATTRCCGVSVVHAHAPRALFPPRSILVVDVACWCLGTLDVRVSLASTLRGGAHGSGGVTASHALAPLPALLSSCIDLFAAACLILGRCDVRVLGAYAGRGGLILERRSDGGAPPRATAWASVLLHLCRRSCWLVPERARRAHAAALHVAGRPHPGAAA